MLIVFSPRTVARGIKSDARHVNSSLKQSIWAVQNDHQI